MKTRIELDDVLSPTPLSAFVEPVLDLGDLVSASVLHMGCDPTELQVDCTGPLPQSGRGRSGRGTRVKLLQIRCVGIGGESLHARAMTWRLSLSNFRQHRRYPLLDGTFTRPHGGPVHEVAIHVHGIDGAAFARAPVVVGGVELALCISRWRCAKSGGTAWLTVRKGGGGRLSWQRVVRSVPDMLECLSILWGNRVVQTRVVGLDVGGQVVRQSFPFPLEHWRSANQGWLVADGNPCKAGPTLEAFAEAWPRWTTAERRWGVASAARYVVRAEQTQELEWQARDYVIAIERLAKVHSGFKKGPLAPQLAALEHSMGVPGLFSTREHEKLVAFRNQLSHSGVLVDGPSRLRRDPYQVVGWLRTLALRYVAHALGLEVPVMDFGSIPHKVRPARSRRFCGPAWTP